MAFRLRQFFKNGLAEVFHIGQRLGVDILPRHWYSEIPAVYQLRQTDHWRKPFSMIGIKGAELDSQLAFVREMMREDVYKHLGEHDVLAEARRREGAIGFGEIEAQFLFAFVAVQRPKHIVQIGCGVSTAICLAAGKYAGYTPQITCVEPYPSELLRDLAANGEIKLIDKKVESAGLDFFQHLGVGDLFFVDSSHTLGPAGEVTRIILELMPRLARGVYVHFHDIYFPYDYSPRTMSSLFFWHESPLLHAFLCMNPSYRISVSMSYLHHSGREDFRKAFHRYTPPMTTQDGLVLKEGMFPSSTYLQVIGD